jgi:hypothetical protein
MFNDVLQQNRCTEQEHSAAMAICERNIHAWQVARRKAK